MNQVFDVQAGIIGQLQLLLAGVPLFGSSVLEDSVAGVLDSGDDSLPDYMIVLQEGDTLERGRQTGTCQEEWTLNIVALTRKANAAASLRTARLEIKRALKGVKAGLDVQGLIKVDFPASVVRLPDQGRRWGYRVIPITFTYVQPL
ncbi:hypothetical protein [Pseudomonas sp.]|uniref:hypothetical protein n=1 Tax=Pseudomonas sp. TaxID=306 RepID=UPI0029089094|nr:hypothetical protein [Pseudomonas sp.]MDU4250482.1 hypothetical protein [Pseudomonas sp.]